MEKLRRFLNGIVAVAILLTGGGVFFWLVRTAPQAPRHERAELVHEVAAVAVAPRVERTPILGHGTVRAKKELDIVPLVPGKIVDIHRNLEPGKTIPKGELLFQVDPTVYDARVRQADAEIRGFEAELARHGEEIITLQDRLSTAKEMLGVQERDYLGTKRLLEVEKVGTQRDLDLVYAKYLQQRDATSEIESRLRMLPHLKTEIEAKLDAARSTLTQAKHDLEGTKIFAPFKARVEAVLANRSQFVTAPFTIAKLTDMEAFEVSVGVDPRELRWLAANVQPALLQGDVRSGEPNVRVRWTMQGQEAAWQGRVTRFERMDVMTRTAQMVVEVRDVDMQAVVERGDADARPELSIGMYVATELPAEPLIDALLVPRHAIHDNRYVYVFEPDASASPTADASRGAAASAAGTGYLRRREIPMLRSVGDEVLVDYRGRDGTAVCELRAGEQVVVSPLLKPIEGMRIRLRGEERSAAADWTSSGSQLASRERDVTATLIATIATFPAREPG